MEADDLAERVDTAREAGQWNPAACEPADLGAKVEWRAKDAE